MNRAHGEHSKEPLARRVWNWLRLPVWERKEPKKDEETTTKATVGAGKLTLTSGGATATAELPGGDGGDGDKDDGGGEEGDDEGEGESSGLGAGILKVTGAAATGITATGFVVIVGAAVFWIRFNELHLPVAQALSMMPRSEFLVQGAQESIIFVAIALLAVVGVYFTDEKGEVTGSTILVLTLLGAGAIGYLFCTELNTGVGFGLAAFAILLAIGCCRIGYQTKSTFWPLALTVFVAALAYSAAVSLLVVKHQKFAQAAAVLRGANDAGVTGIYVTATEKTIYLGVPLGGEKPEAKTAQVEAEEVSSRAMLDIKRGEEVTYAVGPLESVADAGERAGVLLEQLISDREGAKGPSGGTAPTGGSAGSGSGGAGDELPDWVEGKIAEAFSAPIHVREKTEKEPLCLARYAEVGAEAESGHWWTSCAEAERLRTVLDAKDTLALPARFQAVYDERILASVPAEEKVIYLEGAVAPQCEHSGDSGCGYEYKGGGLQFYLPNPAKAEIIAEECTAARPDEASRWAPCPKK